MKEAIRTIHDAEVADFFRSIGLLEELEQGKVSCVICSESLTIASFRAVARKEQKLIFCCSRTSCYASFILRSRVKS